MKKKLLAMLLMVVILFNFILCNSIYATESPGPIDKLNGGTDEGGNPVVLGGKQAEEVGTTGKDSKGTEFKFGNFLMLFSPTFQIIAATFGAVFAARPAASRRPKGR